MISCGTPVDIRGVLAMSYNTLPIAVDAFGTDEGPSVVVQGVADSELPILLVGPEKILTPMVKASKASGRIEVVNADDIIGSEDHPFTAFRTKKNSSMMVAIKLAKDGKAAGVLSSGNTGAFMVGATMILGRLPHVTRPAVAIPIPNTSGFSLLLDAGASTDCTPADLVNFAVMGLKYVELVWNVSNPKVGLLSIGEEETKGTKIAKRAHQVLKESGINFIGNVQGNDLAQSVADVVVTDGFTGNVALKVTEGFAVLMEMILKNEIKRAPLNEKLAAWVLYPFFKRIKKRFDWQEYGGGSLLGVNGNVVIAHGKSGRRAIASATRLCGELAVTDLLRGMEGSLKKHYKLVSNAGNETEEEIRGDEAVKPADVES